MIPLLKDGNVDKVLYVSDDITQLVEQEKSLTETSVFKLLVDNVKDYAMFMLDVNGNVLTWNEGAKKLKQYESDEIIGKNFRIFYLPEDLEKGKPEIELKMAIK